MQGNTTLGNDAASDTLTLTSRVAGNVSFSAGTAHTISIAAQQVAADGTSLTVAAGAGSATGIGGNLVLQGGAAAGFAGARTGGDILLQPGAGAGGGAQGVVRPDADNAVDLGTAANRFRTGRFGSSVVVGSSITITTNSMDASGALGLTSALAAGGTTSSAFNITSTQNLGATDELLQIGDAGATFLTLLGNGRVGIGTTTPAVTLAINATDAVLLPVGTTAQRPTAASGLIRFNTTTTSFEGYNGATWSGLGGVIDVDQDTRILPESVPGADEDILFFYTAGTERMRIDSAGRLGVGDTSPTTRLALGGTGAANGITFGDDAANPASLYRSGADALTTDDALAVTNTLTASNGLVLATGALNLMATSGSAALTLSSSTTAFNVNSGLFNIDTTNSRVGIGTTAPSALLTLGDGADRTINVLTRTSNAAGNALSVQAGNAGAGAAGFAGGNLLLQGGNAAGTTGNANGGDVVLQPGTPVNAGTRGVVRPSDDNAVDLGTAANRFRTGRFGTSVLVGSTITIDTDSVDASGLLAFTSGAGNNIVFTPAGNLNLAAGNFQIGGVTVFDITGGIAISLVPSADNTLTLGSAARRFSSAAANSFNVFGAAADANAVASLSASGLRLGAGGVSAVDVQLSRGAADRLDLASGDSLRLVAGNLSFGPGAARSISVEQASAAGDNLTLAAGAAGSGGTGNNAGGNLALNAGAQAGTGAAGQVQIGAANTSAVAITPNTTIAGTLGVTGATALSGALNANGNTTLGDATSDTVTFTGRVNSNVTFTTDNANDIGASGANRPRTGYFGTSLIVGGTVTIDTDSVDASGALTLSSSGANNITLTPGTGNVNISAGDLQLAGSTRISNAGAATFTTLATSAQNIFSAAAGTAPVVARSATATDDDLRLLPQAGGAARFAGILTSADLTADRTYTFPDLTGTVTLTTNNLSAFAATTSAQLAGVISDETGSGLLVFGTSPSISGVTLTGSPTAAGATWTDLGSVTTIDINGGTIDGATIGWSSAAGGTFTSLSATGNTTLGDATSDTVTFTGRINSNVAFTTDNANDVGASGANRPRTGYFGTSLIVGGTVTIDTDSVDASAGLAVTAGGANALTFSTNSAERMRVDSAGLVGIGNAAPATRLDLTGLTISTDADSTVGAANFTTSLTKNDVNTRTFAGVQIKPTLNTGAANTTTTLNVLNIDTTNTATTGLTTNLIKASYGGTQKFLVDSSGNATLAGTLGVTGTTTLTGAQTLVGNTDLQGVLADSTGNLTITDNVDLTGTLALTGAQTISSTLAVTGTTTLTGLATATAGVTTPANLTTTGTGDLVSADDLTVADAATIGGALGVTGATTLSGALNANGGITFDNATDTLGAFTLGGTVALGGQTLSGNATASGTVTYSGAAPIILSNAAPVIDASAATANLTILSRKTAANTGTALTVQTLNAADAATNRLTISGGVGTAVATWSALTHTGLVLSGALDANTQVISNIGNAGTDFSGTGGLTLADALTVSAGGASITGGLNNNSGGITNAGAISGGTTGVFATSLAAPLYQTADNAAALTVNIPVSGADAAVHTLSLQVDGNTGLSIAATGDGLGAVGARTVQVGVSAAADTVTIGDGNADVSLTDANWSVSGAGAASLASLNVNSGGITNAGAITGATGITSSGTITFSGLTASRMVFTDGSSALASSAASSVVAASVTDETGTGVLVFDTAPTFTTSITDPLVIGGTGTTSTLTLRSTSGVGAAGADIVFQVGNNGATEAMRILNSGNVGIGDASPAALLTVGSGDLFQVDSSGRAFLPSGALGAGTLALSFTGDTNTGIYRGGADILRLATAGSDRVSIDASGNVGIGTTSAGQHVHIFDSAGSATGLRLENSSAGAYTQLELKNDAGNRFDFEIGGSTVADIPNMFAIWDNAASAYRLAIATSGNIGIGTITPGTKLDVSGTGRFSSTLTASSGLTLTTGALSLTGTSGSIALTGFGTTSITSTTATGNINTFADSSLAPAAAATANLLNLTFSNGSTNTTGTSTTTGLNIAPTNNAAGAGGTMETYGIRIQDLAGTAGAGTQNNYGMRIGNQGLASTETSYGLYVDSQTGSTSSYAAVFAGGNVGIGTTAPAKTLDVAGNIQLDSQLQFTGAIGGYAQIQVLNNLNLELQTINTGAILFLPNASERMRIDNNGNVGIGDASPAALLTVGSGDLFQVNSSGNIVKLNNVTTSWPASQGAANSVLTNDGSGNLSWSSSGSFTNLVATTLTVGSGGSQINKITKSSATVTTTGKEVTINDTNVTADAVIAVTLRGGATAGATACFVSDKTASTSFVLECNNELTTKTVDYIIIDPQ